MNISPPKMRSHDWIAISYFIAALDVAAVSLLGREPGEGSGLSSSVGLLSVFVASLLIRQLCRAEHIPGIRPRPSVFLIFAKFVGVFAIGWLHINALKLLGASG